MSKTGRAGSQKMNQAARSHAQTSAKEHSMSQMIRSMAFSGAVFMGPQLRRRSWRLVEFRSRRMTETVRAIRLLTVCTTAAP